MSKHRKHEKQGATRPDDREMYQCEICKKRYPFEGYLPYANSTPFMFLVIADAKHRRFSLAVCMPDMQKTETEELLWFVCADRQCIFKGFLMWREWDRRKHAEAAFLEDIGQVIKVFNSKGAAGLEQDLDEILQHGIIQQGKSDGNSHSLDEAMRREAAQATGGPR